MIGLGNAVLKAMHKNLSQLVRLLFFGIGVTLIFTLDGLLDPAFA